MPELRGPMEILDLQDGGSVEFTPLRFEEGDNKMNMPRPGASELTHVLRVHVPPSDKATFPNYWDVTSKRAVAQLRPLLPGAIQGRRRVRITKHGIAPKATFTVELR